jgi:hypothetical protein
MKKFSAALSIMLLTPLVSTIADAKPKYKYNTVLSENVLTTSSGGQMSSDTSRASVCLRPTRSGRSMIVGSGNVTDVKSSGTYLYNGKSLPDRNASKEAKSPPDYYNIGWWVTKNTSQEICIEIFSRTSAQEVNVYYNARPTAKEQWCYKNCR